MVANCFESSGTVRYRGFNSFARRPIEIPIERNSNMTETANTTDFKYTLLSTEPNSYALAILRALNVKPGVHIYEGTADPVAVARRHAASKRAKQARKANRNA